MRNSMAKRDVLLVFFGASVMYFCNLIFYNADFAGDGSFAGLKTALNSTTRHPAQQKLAIPLSQMQNLPETTIISHAPGWTVFQNLYMSEGTLYVVSSHPRSYFPNIRFITSTGLAAENTPENILSREPTKDNMDYLSPAEAKHRWGGDIEAGERNRVWEVEGNTFLINDPSQFLRHYYHLVAELLFGAWAFWTGTFSRTPFPSPSLSVSNLPHNSSSPPPFQRFIFANANADGWRDDPGFNSYFLRAAFPTLTVEHIEDWNDRIRVTTPASVHRILDTEGSDAQALFDLRKGERAWLFSTVLFADRSAAFRGDSCGSRTQRTASEAVEAMEETDRLPKNWWGPVRNAVASFAGIDDAALSPLGEALPEKIVISYISRQGGRRCLIDDQHEKLVSALADMVRRRNEKRGLRWELNVVRAQDMSKDAQVRMAYNTTIMLGVHGNGLTHLVHMKPSRVSTVIEMFYPGGFAHDYEWTTRALGMKHFAFWNDTHHTYPNEPRVDYPEGFQGTQIPIHGPAVAKLIEDIVDGKL